MNTIHASDLKATVTTPGIDLFSQQPIDQGGGTMVLFGFENAAATAPAAPTIAPNEMAALFYAFRRLRSRIQSAPPRRGLGRYSALRGRGQSWSPAPLRMSNKAQNDFMHINPYAPLRNIPLLLSLFHRLERDGADLSFIRKADMDIIRRLQVGHGLRKTAPAPSRLGRSMGGLRRRPRHYKDLDAYGPSRMVPVYVRGRQADVIADISPAPQKKRRMPPRQRMANAARMAAPAPR